MRKITLSVVSCISLLLVSASAQAQVLSCGPGVGYDTEGSDHVFFIGATCLRTMTLGPLSAGGHLAYGFGSYDVDPDFQDVVDGSYSALRAAGIVTYPISVSDSSPLYVYPMGTVGILRWWEDCDFSDCSDTEFVVDVGGGVSYNQFSAEVYGLLGSSYDFGARIRAMFDLN